MRHKHTVLHHTDIAFRVYFRAAALLIYTHDYRTRFIYIRVRCRWGARQDARVRDDIHPPLVNLHFISLGVKRECMLNEKIQASRARPTPRRIRTDIKDMQMGRDGALDAPNNSIGYLQRTFTAPRRASKRLIKPCARELFSFSILRVEKRWYCASLPCTRRMERQDLRGACKYNVAGQCCISRILTFREAVRVFLTFIV